MIDRKAAIAAYKERKPSPGIFAVRCVKSGDTWVGRAPDLATIANRIWFTLKNGSHSNRVLQAVCTEQGIDALEFEPLEAIPDEDHVATRERMLKEQLAFWQNKLGARLL
jgi:hypothetical protein